MKTARYGTLFALVALLVAPSSAAGLRFTSIALTGVDDYRGPGMGPGVTYLSVVDNSPLLVPNAGQADIYFGALIPATENNPQILLMRHDGASPSVVLAEGLQAPGLPPGVTIADIGSRPMATTNGNFAQSVDLAGAGVTSTDDEAWLVGNPASPNAIRKGSPAPGTGAFFNQMNESRAAITSGGSTFTTTLVGPGVISSNDLATFYSDSLGNVQLIGREGTAVPGNPGLTYAFGADSGWLAGNSSYYFRSTLQGSGITSANDLHVLAWSPGGSTTILAGNGRPVSGIPGASFVGELPSEQRTIGVVPDGSMLLAAAVTGGPFGAGTTSTILAGDATGFTNAIPIGVTVPGTTTQLTGGRNIMVGDSDTFAFMGNMSDGTSGIMVMDRGNLRLILPKPLNSTVLFHVNALGDVVAPDGTQWVYYHRDGNALPLFDTSMLFDADSSSGTDLRTISSSNLSSLTSTIQQRRSGDGPVNFNELGQVVFGLEFSDGSRGIFLATPVPEPASLALVALAALPLVALRRRRFEPLSLWERAG